MPDKYLVASRHPEELASGATFGRGETAVGVDPKDPHDKQLIDEGRLVLIAPAKARQTTKKEETAK